MDPARTYWSAKAVIWDGDRVITRLSRWEQTAKANRRKPLLMTALIGLSIRNDRFRYGAIRKHGKPVMLWGCLFYFQFTLFIPPFLRGK